MSRVLPLLLAAALAGCASAARPGAPAPDASFVDADGRPARLSDLRGHLVLVDFWATWCEPCKDTLPLYQKLYDERRADGFVVVGVSEDEPGVDANAFARARALTYPVWRDPGRAAYRAFGAFELPSAFLVDADGKVVKRWDGFVPVDADAVVRAVDALAPRK